MRLVTRGSPRRGAGSNWRLQNEINKRLRNNYNTTDCRQQLSNFQVVIMKISQIHQYNKIVSQIHQYNKIVPQSMD